MPGPRVWPHPRTAVALSRVLQTWEQLWNSLAKICHVSVEHSTVEPVVPPTGLINLIISLSFLNLSQVLDSYHVQWGGNYQERELFFLLIWTCNILKLWFYVKLQLRPKQKVGKRPSKHTIFYIYSLSHVGYVLLFLLNWSFIMLIYMYFLIIYMI